MSVTTSEVIDVTVLGDMSLHLHPADIGREGEHNSAVFHIVQQPASLDPLACRAEVTIAGKSTYRLVEDGFFNLTNDITEVKGTGQLQLVYSDGTDVIRKTTIAVFQVTSSLNAVDQSDPDFQDGLAQLQSAAFTSVVDPPPGGDVATFFNINGNPVAVLRFPVAAVGGDLTEVRARTLFLPLDGLVPMAGSVNFAGPNRGVTWETSGIQGALYSSGTQLVMRLPIGDPPFVIESNSGNAGTRTPVVTQASGDARYAQASALDAYLPIDGSTAMSGDLRLIAAAGIDAPIRLQVGGRQAAVRWENALILTRGQANEPVQIENNDGSSRSDILTMLTGLPRSGGQMTGPLITQTGSSNTNLGLSVGDNSTGFWRTGTYLICVMSGQMVWQSNTTELMFGVRVNMATGLITNVGAPTAAGDATNRSYVDGAVAAVRPNSRTYLTNTVDLLNTTTQILLDQLYPVANNNPRTIVVTVFPTFEGGTPSAFYDLIYTCSVAPLIEARSTVYPTAGAYMQSPVRFAATVTPAANAIQVQIVVRLNATATGPLTIVGSSENKRSYVTIEEQAN